MQFSKACVLGLSAPALAYAFMQPQSLKTSSIVQTSSSRRGPQFINTELSRWSQDPCPSTQLNMAFTEPERGSNMFDGPLALTKERDACGVGFVANTKLGGTGFIILRS